MKNEMVKIFVALLVLSSCNNQKKYSKPNIVLILADDLGVPQVGCYGTDYYQTPNIDRLAETGTRFTNAYTAASICSPTRASIFTGKYPARLHLTDFIPGRNYKNKPLNIPDWQKWLPTEEVTIAEKLKEAGYNTALFGKWHLSKSKIPPKSLPFNPDRQGFEETFVTYKPAKRSGLPSWQKPEKDAHNVDTLTNRAVDYIQRHKDDPFFLVISHNSIHDPLMEKEASIAKYRNSGKDKEENNPIIAAMVERLDKSVGKVTKTIDNLRLGENTLLIFYSDNGAKHAYARQTPFRKGKGWLYEGGIRVPMIARWNGKIKAESTINDPVSSIDLFPTFMEIAKSENKNITDGISLVNTLTKGEKINRQDLYWHYPHYHGGSGMKPASAIRSGKYKLVEWHENKLLGLDNTYELYDLENDIGEQKNLINSMPKKAEELKLKLDKWKMDVKAQSPTINQNYVTNVTIQD
ncbi:sulfatase [Fulvitalea axinellae]|uniref:Sulfatase n=1 Tax=Fulvitalea axinellae TaxID=1182444 RepID=A0AAU9CN06_9BACT|nr:sulfatase [Fulvitalea axinellae]